MQTQFPYYSDIFWPVKIFVVLDSMLNYIFILCVITSTVNWKEQESNAVKLIYIFIFTHFDDVRLFATVFLVTVVYILFVYRHCRYVGSSVYYRMDVPLYIIDTTSAEEAFRGYLQCTNDGQLHHPVMYSRIHEAILPMSCILYEERKKSKARTLQYTLICFAPKWNRKANFYFVYYISLFVLAST